MKIWTTFRRCSPQLIAVLLGTINAISDGMQFGWTSPMIPRYQEEDAPFQMSEFDVTWLEITYMLSGVLGLPITIFLVDRIGRKKSVLVAGSVCIIGWILIGIADNVLNIYIARFLMGLSADIAFIASPMYIAEVAHQNIRGFLSGIIYIMVFIGILTIYCIGPFLPLYVPSLIGVSILLIQLSTFSFMPESPYFLLYKGRENEARNALRKLRGESDKEIEDELVEISLSIKRQKSEKGRPQDLWLVKSNRRAALIMTILNGAQHMGGLTVITMNVHTILSEAESIYLSAESSAILFAGIMLISTMVSVTLIDKFGRRVLLMISVTFSCASLLSLAVFFNAKHNGIDVSDVSWLPLACILIFAMFFKSGMGIIPIIMTAELFPAKIKAIGMGYADGIYILSSAISIYLYRYLVESFNMSVAFYMFGTCCFLTGIFTYFFIPETKGKTLEEIQMILKK